MIKITDVVMIDNDKNDEEYEKFRYDRLKFCKNYLRTINKGKL